MREFNSFGAFSRHLAVTAAIGDAVTHHITEKAAAIVQRDAQNRIGEYQDHVGPFKAWAPLAESTMADRVAQGFTPNDPLERTGGLRDSIEATTHGNDAVVGSDSEIMLYQEIGTDRGIPPRAVLGPALYDSKLSIGMMAANTVVAWLSGRGWKRPRQVIELP